MNKQEYHKKLTESIHETYLKKNADYGDSFSESFKEFGIISAVVRMSDKWNRIKNLAKLNKPQVYDESIRDTLLDLSNYCIMTVQELDLQKQAADNKAFESGLPETIVLPCENKEVENVTLPFTPDEDEEDELLDNVVAVAGDGDYIVPEKWLERFGANKIGSMIAFRNAGWSQTKIADEFSTHQKYISELLRSIERV